jgi:predicted membrane protein
MNQTKFSLADVLTILTALGFGYMCFLGTNFYTLGNVPKSVTAALIITILLFSTAFTAKRLKRTSVNFKTRFIWEMAVLAVFTLLLVVFTYMPFSHYFTVSAKKSEIVSKIQTSITQAENMFPAYEAYAESRKDLYNSKLKSVMSAVGTNPTEYTNYGFKNGIPAETQLNKKMGDLNADLFPTNYSDLATKKGIKEVATNWLLDAKNTTASWKPIGITNVVVEVESKSNEWLYTLVEISKIREKGEQQEDFSYTLTFNDIKKHFTTVEKPSSTSLLIASFMWVLMMLSYFVTKRHTRFPGFKLLFNTSQASNNEL